MDLLVQVLDFSIHTSIQISVLDWLFSNLAHVHFLSISPVLKFIHNTLYYLLQNIANQGKRCIWEIHILFKSTSLIPSNASQQNMLPHFLGVLRFIFRCVIKSSMFYCFSQHCTNQRPQKIHARTLKEPRLYRCCVLNHRYIYSPCIYISFYSILYVDVHLQIMWPIECDMFFYLGTNLCSEADDLTITLFLLRLSTASFLQLSQMFYSS